MQQQQQQEKKFHAISPGKKWKIQNFENFKNFIMWKIEPIDINLKNRHW